MAILKILLALHFLPMLPSEVVELEFSASRAPYVKYVLGNSSMLDTAKNHGYIIFEQ